MHGPFFKTNIFQNCARTCAHLGVKVLIVVLSPVVLHDLASLALYQRPGVRLHLWQTDEAIHHPLKGQDALQSSTIRHWVKNKIRVLA